MFRNVDWGTGTRYANQLKMIWLRRKLFDDMLGNTQIFGNRSVAEIAADLQTTEDALVWASAFFKKYDEKAVDELAVSGLAWPEVYSLVYSQHE